MANAEDVAASSGDAKRLKMFKDVVECKGLYDKLREPSDADGFLSVPPEVVALTSKADDILVRESYRKLFRQIKHSRNAFVHVSGNPGTGKSCCIWYFVHELLSDEQTKGSYVVVQLVVSRKSTYLTISPESQVWRSAAPPSEVLLQAGTWLLVDRMFAGDRATLNGKTVLFASPSKANGATDAEKTMDENRFTTMVLDAWKPSELLKVFNRRFMRPLGSEVLDRVNYDASKCYPPTSVYSAAAHFLARLYVCGGIVGLFFQDLDIVMARQAMAVKNYVITGMEEGGDKVFYHRPTYTLRRVAEIVMVSPYVRKVYASAVFEAGLKTKESFANLAKRNPKFSAAAGDFFEDYAHLLLSTQGGTYHDINKPNCFVTFMPRINKFHIPLSSSLGIVDSYDPRQGFLLQMSLATKRNLMDKSKFDELVEMCKDEMQRTAGDVVIDGASVDDPVFIHVRPHDGKATNPVFLKDPVPGKMTPKGNQSWQRAELAIPQLTIALPAMSGKEVHKLNPVYEVTSEEVLEKMQELVKEGKSPLFEQELEDVCGECGEGDTLSFHAADDWRLCNGCDSWIHFKCWPRCSHVCLTCALAQI